MPTEVDARLTWLTFAGARSQPMGLQHYEIQVLAALERTSQLAWSFDVRSASSLRSDTAASVRLPMGLLQRSPTALALALGAYATRGAQLVHRFDLRLPPPRAPEVITVHDLPPLRFDDEGQLPRWSVPTAKRARLVICPSTFAASEAEHLLGVKEIAVVPNGVSNEFRQARPPDPWPDWLPRRYVLHVGGATKRKNLGGLGEAWRRVQEQLPDVSLVLVGPPDARRDAAVRGCARVHGVGYLPSTEVARLMAGALAVVVPSTYEGYGLPAAEAMASGTPVIAAACGALPEVCGEAAMVVDPNPDALARGLAAIVHDHDLQAELRARGPKRVADLTWDRCAQGLLAAYDRAFT